METTFETKEVVIKKLVTEGLQIRVEMNEDCINDYAEIYRTWQELEADKRLPPVTVFYDIMGDEYYLADGFHRVIAAKRAGWEKIPANVYEGTFNDALKFALSANSKHGLHRTNADKQNAMMIAWENREVLFASSKIDTRHFATLCGVSVGTSYAFLEKKGLFNLNKKAIDAVPDAVEATVSKVTGRELLATSERVKNAVATKGNRQHLEERNKTVSALLKEGKDRYGMEIPERLLPAFDTCSPSAFLHDLGALREELEECQRKEVMAFAHSIAYALRDLDATIRDLRQGQPHCVCRMCRGKGCGSCSGFGFQTKLQYDRVPREYKAEKQ